MYKCFRTVLSANIWLEPKLWSKSEPEINNFGSATLLKLRPNIKKFPNLTREYNKMPQNKGTGKLQKVLLN